MEKMSSSMTSSITGMGLGGITGLTTAISTLSCAREQQITIGGMASNYVPGLSANYNISSFCQRPGQSRRCPIAKAGPTAQPGPGRSHSAGALKHSSRNNPNTAYAHDLICKLADQNERRRLQETLELVPQSYYSQQPLKVELTEFYARDNGKDHHTDQYELVNDATLPNPVLRRGQNFFFAMRFDRICDKQQDIIRIVFSLGPKPCVTKGTRVVLTVNWSTQQTVFQHARDVIGMGMGMAVSRIQETSSASMAPAATITTISAISGPISGIRETATYACRRSSFSSDPVPQQQSPLSPHGAAEPPRPVVERHSGPPQPPSTGRSYGSHHGSTQNLASVANEMEKWDLSIQRQDGNTITFQVHVPASAPVGVWNCWIQTQRLGQRDNRQDYKCDEDIYILFNPWCREDSVYMDSELSRKEYILNEQGKIWSGTWRQPKGRKWIFGQFDDVVLPACIYLLERSGLEHSERGNPVRITRAISAMINSKGNGDGLMVGRYDGEYKDGVSPHSWTGSVAILERYLTNGGRPVEYGQCWVFSGLVVTICRALGIPCRSVTNYVSAHDTNGTFTIDKFFDKDGNEVPNGPDEDCFDSCWNFHVWNDVWMQRTDLPQGYGGWQIIDATPQEEAESVYKCGPASVEAVRRGEVGFQYDTPFMYSQINAELCHFQEEESSDWGFVRMASNQYQVGRKIITKDPSREDDEGDSDLLEITHEYKPVESPSPERLSVIASSRGFQRLQQYYELPDRSSEDVVFDLMDIEPIPYGQPFDCTMNIQNKSPEDRTIWCVLTASSCYYTGAIAARVRRSQGEFIVRAGQREALKLNVTPQEYMDKLVDHAMVKVHAMAFVKQTQQAWSEEDDIALHKPKLQVQTRSQPSIGQDCGITFSFQNPLSVSLTDCYFTFEGSGVQRPRQIKFRDVKPGEFMSYQDKFVPTRTGELQIVVTFSTRQIDEIFGCATVNVRG
ncbi:hemocyte protein-glutamine gamma-glutamyltransferase-like [Maniola hyperantus]|uniref:hemocyte protein-glutamine gamma-glutamyltransferase-like n=1 Tax=Aphantopus hyperantus TaxID=2795564 RepID=UPI001569E8BA|nr:hemocyte protein-glutamine gamma-glutamyltransferase-like [Maniola hyperantus]